ncbi:sarcosine oxidase subunit delta [Thalassotalea nanhaiensis]|uniref:Sarcosine oxidase subunit delta n=1 Tax=Thalassotalea nanhaiensis TaxID=3065648 RepID=A0ABY9TDV7_9GAMM|nr:sarcosine oxidase subunit delta [Colwelliaceae bacterium SQ345]
MMIVPCPICGDRDEDEFTCGGQAGIVRPEQPENVTDEEWSDYLFVRKNTMGLQRELWRHTYGCRQWFTIDRNTITHEVTAVADESSTASSDQEAK